MNIPEVNPEDVFLISVLLEDGLKALLETIDRGLACAEDGEARKLATELIRLHIFISQLFSPHATSTFGFRPKNRADICKLCS